MARKMKDSGIEWIGDIPEDWEIAKLKYTSDSNIPHSFEDGDWIESKYISEDGIRYLTTGNIGDGEYKEQGSGYVSEENFKILNCKYAYPNDLIFSRLNAPYGRSCLLPDNYNKYVVAVDNVILRPSNNYDKKFMNYLTQCRGYQKSVEDSASGTTMQRISRTKLGNIQLPFPIIETQKIISHILDKKTNQIYGIRNTINKEIESLENYKKSLITEAVTKGLDKNVEMKDSGIEWIGQIPKKWKKIELRYLSNIVRGGSPRPISNYMSDEDSDLNWIKIGDTEKGSKYINKTKNKLKISGLSSTTYVKKGELILSNSMSYGEAYILNIDGCIHDGWLAFKEIKNVDQEYLYFSLLSSNTLAQFDMLCDGGVVQNLNIDKVKTVKIFIPNLDEQINIADYLNKKTKLIDQSISLKQKQLQTLEEYKKSLIYEYVTGKKEV